MEGECRLAPRKRSCMFYLTVALSGIGGVAAFLGLLWLLNALSYGVLKERILQEKSWDLNVCCGRSDGGGVNADIVQHTDLPKMVLVDICRLPFGERKFESVLCSHTMEHVPDPRGFYRELRRVGKDVTIVLPPLWDLGAVFNISEHRWIFLTFRKRHSSLPPYIRLPFSRRYRKRFGQKIRA